MPIYKRKDLDALLAATERNEIFPIYLLVGDYFLCRQVVDDLVARLLPDETLRRQNLKNIDGEQEDQMLTLNKLRTHNLFPGRHLYLVRDSRLLYSKEVAKTLWEKAQKQFQAKELKRSRSLLLQMLELAGVEEEWNADDFLDLSDAIWKEKFSFSKPQDVTWVKEVLSENAAAAPESKAPARQGHSPAELYHAALEKGVPKSNILILMTEVADKRKKLFDLIKGKGAVIDLSVTAGLTSAAKKEQEGILQELVQNKLAEFKKKLEPGLMPLLFERVGFYPVAIVMETEKLALYAGEKALISRNDLDTVVGRTREEALFELTETFGNRNLADSLLILSRMRDNDVHPLIIVSGLRNYIRKMLRLRACQDLKEPVYRRGMPFNQFQDNYLPGLKTILKNSASLLAGHPYGLYMSFSKAEKFSQTQLKQALGHLLHTEYKLKSSGLEGYLLLEDLFFQLLPPEAYRA